MYDAGGGGGKPGGIWEFWAGCRPVPARCLSFLGTTSPSRCKRDACGGLEARPASRYQALGCARGDDNK